MPHMSCTAEKLLANGTARRPGPLCLVILVHHCSHTPTTGGCGISVGHTKYTNASLLRVLGVHGLERNRETIWKQSTHICFDGH